MHRRTESARGAFDELSQIGECLFADSDPRRAAGDLALVIETERRDRAAFAA